jgi:hypothetical protein
MTSFMIVLRVFATAPGVPNRGPSGSTAIMRRVGGLINRQPGRPGGSRSPASGVATRGRQLLQVMVDAA